MVKHFSSEQMSAYSVSLRGVRRTKTKINGQLRGKLTQKEKESRMYKVELLNAIESCYRVILGKSDERFTHSKKRWSKKKLSQ